MSNENNHSSFIDYLEKLVDKQNRGALADLRSGVSYDLGVAPRMHKHIVDFLDARPDEDDKWYYLVGILFALHPENTKQNKSFGKSFKELSYKGSESIEARFLALLAARDEDLKRHLITTIGLLKSSQISINYLNLLDDLCKWNHPDKYIQTKWAREYYKSNYMEETDNE